MDIKVWLLIATMINGGQASLPFVEREWCIWAIQALDTRSVLNARCLQATYVATSIFAPETSQLPPPKPGVTT